MALAKDVAQVLRRASARRIVLAHVAQPSGKLGNALAVAGVSLPLHRKVGGLEKLRAGDEGHAGDAEDFHSRLGCRLSAMRYEVVPKSLLYVLGASAPAEQ